MLNRRLDERLESRVRHLFKRVQALRIAREKEALQQSVIFIGDQFQTGLDALVSETNRAVRDGFTESELDRVKADVLRSLEGAFDERDKTNSDTYAAEYLELSRWMSRFRIEMELEVTQSFVGDISLQEINAMTRFAQESSRVALFSGPERIGVAVRKRFGGGYKTG